jgi:hypothetical protein
MFRSILELPKFIRAEGIGSSEGTRRYAHDLREFSGNPFLRVLPRDLHVKKGVTAGFMLQQLFERIHMILPSQASLLKVTVPHFVIWLRILSAALAPCSCCYCLSSSAAA